MNIDSSDTVAPQPTQVDGSASDQSKVISLVRQSDLAAFFAEYEESLKDELSQLQPTSLIEQSQRGRIHLLIELVPRSRFSAHQIANIYNDRLRLLHDFRVAYATVVLDTNYLADGALQASSSERGLQESFLRQKLDRPVVSLLQQFGLI